jgi:hypothetical protein
LPHGRLRAHRPGSAYTHAKLGIFYFSSAIATPATESAKPIFCSTSTAESQATEAEATESTAPLAASLGF